MGVYVQGNYAYITTWNGNWGAGNANVSVIDISNPSLPVEAGHYAPNDNFQPSCIEIVGDYAYVGSQYQDLRILDVSDLSSISLVAQYEEYSRNIQFRDNTLFISALTEGLIILDVSNTSNIDEIGYYEPSGDAYGLHITDNTAYAALGQNGVIILDITDLSNPVLVGSFDTTGYANNVFVKDDYAYVADGMGGLCILDISNAGAPVETGIYKHESATSFRDVLVQGNYAYVADDTWGIIVLDVSNKESPAEVGYYETGPAYAIFLQGNIIYGACQSGLFILQNEIQTSVEEQKNQPKELIISQNYPNPFNPSTTISYQLSERKNVEISVFNVSGQLVAKEDTGMQSVGMHTYTWDASGFSTGVYVCSVRSGQHVKQIKMLLMK